MGKMQRDKGNRGQRELAAKLNELLGFQPGDELAARNGCQRKGGPTSQDIEFRATPDLHWESKYTERLSLYPALEQAIEDAKGEQLPIVAHRKNRKDWVLIMRIEDLAPILDKAGYVLRGPVQ